MKAGQVGPAVKSVQDEYRRLAATYEERWAGYVKGTTARTLAHLRPQAGERILDVGCGTGALLRAVTSRAPNAQVVGVDLSLQMLKEAGTQLGLGVGDAARLPLRSGTFDAVASVSSFHYWPQPAEALREIARVLRPNGRVVLTDWCDDFLACRLCDRWLRLTRTAYQRIYGATECRSVVEAAGLRVESLVRYKVSWLWGMMTMVARVR